jgi:hypothetical protein
MPTRTPAAKIEWSNRWLDATLSPGVPGLQSITFRVTQPIVDATVKGFAPSGTLSVGEIPSTLLPGQDYTLQIALALPEDRRRWPMRGTITIRSGRRSVGPIVQVRGKGPVEPTATPTTGLTRTPTVTRDTSPTASPTATPIPGRVSWTPPSLTQALVPGDTARVMVSFSVTRPIAAPQLRVYTRGGVVSIDPATLPGSVEPGQLYSIALNLAMPSEGPAAEVATVLVRDGTRSLGDALTVRIVPRSVPTPTT